MKRRRMYEVMSNVGGLVSAVSALGYIRSLKKISAARTEEELEKEVKKSKILGALTGTGAIVGGSGLILDSLTADQLTKEEMDELVNKAKEEIQKEIEEEIEEEEVEEIIIDDSDIEI